jgi:arginine repressor
MNTVLATNNNKEQDLQASIENVLKNNPSRSYSREEIINLLSSDHRDTQQEIERILGEMEVWSSMKDTQSSIYSSCKGGTVYFQWGQTP